jgi:chromosome segregation ATPase
VSLLESNLNSKVEEIKVNFEKHIELKNSVLEKTIKSEVTAVQSNVNEVTAVQSEIKSDISQLNRKVEGIESGISMLQQTMMSMLREMNDRI